MKFSNRMDFTTEVHNKIAIPKIYTPLGITNIISEVGTKADLRDGIDYIGHFEGQAFTIQERFRQPQYKNYTDITFRYDSPDARGDTRREFFKIKAEAFLYGIANDTGDDFAWAYMFAVEPVLEAVVNGEIVYQYKSNGPNDTGFIAIEVSAIDSLGATIIRYKI